MRASRPIGTHAARPRACSASPRRPRQRAGALAAPASRERGALRPQRGARSTLAVNRKGEALVSYVRSDGQPRHVARLGGRQRQPAVDPDGAAGALPFDYAGGWGKYRNPRYWQAFRDACVPYDGPPLRTSSPRARRPTARTGRCSPGGGGCRCSASHRGSPSTRGASSTSRTGRASCRSSRSSPTGRTAAAGRVSSGASPTSAHRCTVSPRPAKGNPKERYGRNVYIDTLDSVYGPGWKRESGILTHRPTGTFCHSFVPQKPHPGYPSKAMRPAAPGKALPRHGDGPGRDPGRPLGGPGADPGRSRELLVGQGDLRPAHGRRRHLRPGALTLR